VKLFPGVECPLVGKTTEHIDFVVVRENTEDMYAGVGGWLKKNTADEVATQTAYRTWMCVVCGFIYDEAVGIPEEGIAAGTRWDDVPDTWTCPDCGVTKDDFEMIVV
jgi:rubredoxin